MKSEETVNDGCFVMRRLVGSVGNKRASALGRPQYSRCLFSTVRGSDGPNSTPHDFESRAVRYRERY
jgi:hypothetical protein